MDCIFCTLEKNRIIAENESALAFYDGFPVNEGHSLIIPKRHVQSFFDITEEELLAINSLIKAVKAIMDKKYSPKGYNVGVNIGETAGQSIMHVHVHLIPRYEGDVERPKSGIRNF